MGCEVDAVLGDTVGNVYGDANVAVTCKDGEIVVMTGRTIAVVPLTASETLTEDSRESKKGGHCGTGGLYLRLFL